MRYPLIVRTSPSLGIKSPRVLLKEGVWEFSHDCIDTDFDASFYQDSIISHYFPRIEIIPPYTIIASQKIAVEISVKIAGTEKFINVYIVKTS
jgi:hypothetical protein